jgi:hypothetical protein
MAERRRKRAPIASRRTRQPWRGGKPGLTGSDAFIALARAWTVTTIVTTLLLAALAIASVWDRAIFMQALREALSSEPQLAQPVDEATADPRQAVTTPHQPR